jgi:cytochrome d ubiquinol oxidase subunit II
VGFTYRNKLTHPRWRELWDWALTIGGGVPALLFGVAFGNLFLGLPYHFDDWHRPIFTGGFFGLLQPFALLVGVVSLSMLIMQGSAYASLKVGPPMSARAASFGRVAAMLFVATFIVAGIWVAVGLDGQQITSVVDTAGPSSPFMKSVTAVRGGWLGNYQHHGVLWLAPGVAILAALMTWFSLGAGRAGAAFVSSCVVQAGTILTAGIALFPFLMPSVTNPSQGLTIWDASSSERTLSIMLVAVIIFLPIVLAYTAWVFRVLKGRITLDELRRHTGIY